jgi:Acetyltransferase (GNAT) domain
MHVDLIEPTDRRWHDMLATIRHDVYHLPGYISLESSRLGGTAVAAYVDQPGVRLLLPLIRRATPGGGAFDLVSPYGYPAPIAQFEDVASIRDAFTAVVHTLRETGFVSMFVRLHPILELPDDALTGSGALVEQGQTVSIDLHQNESEQWHGIRGRFRTSLNRSERLGHRAFMDDTGEHLDRFTALYLDTMRRQNAAAEYFYTRDYLSGLWHELRGHIHLGIVEVDGEVACAGLFGESDGIVQYHLSGTDEKALELSPLKTLINFGRCWATRRGADVLHLGGGVGGAQDSLMQFKGGFSGRRHAFKTWRVVLDEQRYEELSGGGSASTDYFPAYRRRAVPTAASGICS